MHKYVNLMMLCLLAVTLAGQLYMTLHIGYMSDDYSLMHSAANHSRLWDLHYSPPLEFLWSYATENHVSASTWHLGIFLVHCLNAALIYLLAARCLQLSTTYALFASTLYAMSASGIEVLTWTCCAGYVLTMFWLFIALLSFFSLKDNDKHLLTKSLYFALLQGLAILTWSWGGLLFPILFIFAFFIARNTIPMLIPMGAVWVAISLIRTFSSYKISVQNNSLTTMLQYVAGAPLLSLFPNWDKSLFLSAYGIVLLAAVLGFLSWSACRQRVAMATMLCFFTALGPWVLHSNPSSRYLYIATPFLYLTIALGLSAMKRQTAALSFALAILCFQGLFAYQRGMLWITAYDESELLINELTAIAEAAPLDKKIIVINLPDSYGPEQMPMRPQMWNEGYNQRLASTGREIKLIKTLGCPFIHQKQSHLVDRDNALKANNDTLVYEVVSNHPDQWGNFSIQVR